MHFLCTCISRTLYHRVIQMPRRVWGQNEYQSTIEFSILIGLKGFISFPQTAPLTVKLAARCTVQ